MGNQNFFLSLLALCSTAFAAVPNPAFGQSPDNDGNGQFGVTVQLPTLGVAIDSAGVLTTKFFADPGGHLIRERLDAAKRDRKPQLQLKSPSRKISLRRLEQAIADSAESGKEFSDELQSLAGMTRIEFVFIMPEDNDIVLAGPAEPWIEDPAGRSIGIFSAEPTLLLEDLVVALRTFAPDQSLNSWVACSIDPSAPGLAKLQDFQKRLPRQVPESAKKAAAIQFAEEMRNSLGLANVKVPMSKYMELNLVRMQRM